MMMDVSGDDHPAAGNVVTDQLGSKVFPPRYVLHLLRNNAFTCVMDLGPDRIPNTPHNPLGAIHVPIIVSPGNIAAAAEILCPTNPNHSLDFPPFHLFTRNRLEPCCILVSRKPLRFQLSEKTPDEGTCLSGVFYLGVVL